jgi:polysaccharide pyruvyl transferase CsaB
MVIVDCEPRLMNPKRKKHRKHKSRDGNLHPRVMISGYYGFDNLGDELILKVLVDELKSHQVDVTVLSQNPSKTAAQYGVRAIKRTSVLDIIDELAKTNLFISGGGGLFQDATGPMSAIYYGGLIHLAQFFEVPVCFWAQGVGPLRKPMSRKMAASAMNRCEIITVRDEGSAALVKDLTGTRPEITADPVWLLNTGKHRTEGPRNMRDKHRRHEPWRIGISLRPWHELTDKREQALADQLKALAKLVDCPVEFWLLPFQKEEDTHLLEGFAKRLENAANAKTVFIPPGEVMEKVGHCHAIIGMRFHSLILGLLHQIPVYGLVYDPKVASLLAMFKLQGSRIDALETLQAKTIRDHFEHYPEVDLQPMKQQSRRNFQILNQLLNIPEGELLI